MTQDTSFFFGAAFSVYVVVRGEYLNKAHRGGLLWFLLCNLLQIALNFTQKKIIYMYKQDEYAPSPIIPVLNTAAT